MFCVIGHKGEEDAIALLSCEVCHYNKCRKFFIAPDCLPLVKKALDDQKVKSNVRQQVKDTETSADVLTRDAVSVMQQNDQSLSVEEKTVNENVPKTDFKVKGVSKRLQKAIGKQASASKKEIGLYSLMSDNTKVCCKKSKTKAAKASNRESCSINEMLICEELGVSESTQHKVNDVKIKDEIRPKNIRKTSRLSASRRKATSVVEELQVDESINTCNKTEVFANNCTKQEVETKSQELKTPVIKKHRSPGKSLSSSQSKVCERSTPVKRNGVTPELIKLKQKSAEKVKDKATSSTDQIVGERISERKRSQRRLSAKDSSVNGSVLTDMILKHTPQCEEKSLIDKENKSALSEAACENLTGDSSVNDIECNGKNFG